MPAQVGPQAVTGGDRVKYIGIRQAIKPRNGGQWGYAEEAKELLSDVELLAKAMLQAHPISCKLNNRHISDEEFANIATHQPKNCAHHASPHSEHRGDCTKCALAVLCEYEACKTAREILGM